MTLDKSFNVVEPMVKRAMPDQPYAGAWVTMWLEQHAIDDPSKHQIETAIKAYGAKFSR